MQVIGLTGSIATGKSTVRKMCEEMGIATLDVDELAHQLLFEGGGAQEEVVKKFPEAVEGGEIDRKLLGDIVFSDKNELEKLEAILHPPVKEKMRQWIAIQKQAGHNKVVIEVPLLFEAGWQNEFSKTIVVWADEAVIKQRAMARQGMTEERLNNTLKRQWPQEKKCEHADLVIDSGQSKEVCFSVLKTFLDSLN